jgi:hypothetical protein
VSARVSLCLSELHVYKGSATIRLWLRLARAALQDPKYGYGEQGSFSFPAVPPHERLTYEVECVDFEAPDEEDVSGARPPACVGL